MIWVDKIKTYHAFIVSAVFHLLVVAMLLKIFSSSDKFDLASDIQPVAVISGSEFEAIKTKFFKDQKKSIATRSSEIANIALKEEVVQEKQKGSKESNLKDGLNLDLSTKESNNHNNSYANIIANKIEQNKSYISMSTAPENVQTKVIIKVVINKDGGLESYKIVKSFNYNFFNKAAIKILELSVPFPTPPNNLTSLEFDIPIFFDTI